MKKWGDEKKKEGKKFKKEKKTEGYTWMGVR